MDHKLIFLIIFFKVEKFGPVNLREFKIKIKVIVHFKGHLSPDVRAKTCFVLFCLFLLKHSNNSNFNHLSARLSQSPAVMVLIITFQTKRVKKTRSLTVRHTFHPFLKHPNDACPSKH